MGNKWSRLRCTAFSSYSKFEKGANPRTKHSLAQNILSVKFNWKKKEERERQMCFESKYEYTIGNEKNA